MRLQQMLQERVGYDCSGSVQALYRWIPSFAILRLILSCFQNAPIGSKHAVVASLQVAESYRSELCKVTIY